jgi:hypothetical protein
MDTNQREETIKTFFTSSSQLLELILKTIESEEPDAFVALQEGYKVGARLSLITTNGAVKCLCHAPDGTVMELAYLQSGVPLCH